ncbi:MAG TPA: hypothetical protein VJ461_00170 [Candidatus Nanoarchaeia archaeon]|nr:hypothetical protein [Candidatus Nanoarchaeia archaeon]
MDVDDIYERVKGKEVSGVLDDLIYQLNLLRPNGRSIHTLNTLIADFNIISNLYRKGVYPQNESFQAYKERKYDGCNNTIKAILRAIEEFQVCV